MRFFSILLSVLLVGTAVTTVTAEVQSVEISFFGEKLSIAFNNDLYALRRPLIEGRSLRGHYRALSQTNYQVLLENLKSLRVRLELNDWLYFELIRTSVSHILEIRSDSEQELLNWFLLSQSGFDTRITFRQQNVFVCVYSVDEIFEAPLIEDAGRTYVNLTNIHSPKPDEEGVFLLDFAPHPSGEAFSFKLRKLPVLPAQLETRQLEFSWQGIFFKFMVESDRNLTKIMERYPMFAEEEYLEVPLSSALSRSLLPQLREALKNRTVVQSIEILVSLTRSAFRYKEDKEYFGKSKPMIPDEVLHYPYSDCEDRSALFYSLVKELLHLPMIILAFPDHLTIGVALPDYDGDPIVYQGKNYYVCDPTGPANSVEIGRIPEEFVGQKYQVIGSYP
jgi:hypothetical protein